MSADNDDLRRKIDEAKRRLPLPDLMSRLGLGEHAKKSARCPFHSDEHPSFSVFQGEDGFWHWNCFAGCGDGDEIMFLSKLKGLSLTKAMNLYLAMAGFPSGRPPKSHEYPKSRESPKSPECPESLESPVFPASPVSNGQELDGGKEKVLKAFGSRNACTELNTARKRRFKLVRDLRAIEKGTGQKLETGQLMVAFNEWHRLSQPFLDPAKTRDAYLAAFLAELCKVRVPTGDGDTINKAVDRVRKLSVSELPQIPGMPDAPESWRRVGALHLDLSRSSKNGTYFLSYRDAAKACENLSHQEAHTITGALVRLGVIEIIRKGKAGLNSRKAAEFRYLLSHSANGETEIAA